MQQYKKKLPSALLAELRSGIESEKITQKTVGSTLKLKQSAVSTLLSGKSRLSMDQFLSLCELLGRDPSELLQKAAKRSQQTLPMTPEIEAVLYRSDLHILLYAAATQNLSPNNLRIPGYDIEQIRKALGELVEIGLLKQMPEDNFVQKNPNIIYRAFNRLSNSKLHQKIVNRSWNYFDSKLSDETFKKDKFHYYQVDRFTPAQINEIQSELWKLYERINSIQQSNLLNNYQSQQKMSLWNLHLMLMTPIDIRET